MKTCVYREGRIFCLRLHRKISVQLSFRDLRGNPGEFELARTVVNGRPQRGKKNAITENDFGDASLASNRRNITHGGRKLDPIEQRDVSFLVVEKMETAIAQPHLFDLRPGCSIFGL